jgi:GTP cyclohydrolase II
MAGRLRATKLKMTDTEKKAGEDAIDYIASSLLPTIHGTFHIHVYRSREATPVEHVVMAMGELRDQEKLLVRVHSECLTGDVFGSLRCDCGAQLDDAMARIAKAGSGAIVYLRGHEGRGIGLGNKILAYQLQDQGRDTVEANLDLGLPVDTRDYQAAEQMTNNPGKLAKLKAAGINVVERVPVQTRHTKHNIRYLRTKKEKLGHILDFD